MSVRNLDKMFNPTSVALIGAGATEDSVGGVVLRNLTRAGFKGSLMLVNPHHTILGGLPVYPDIASLPTVPDLAIIATPPDTVPGLIAELGGRGTRAAVVITAGFGELGERGRALQRAALEAARPHLLRIIGPNCVGIMVPGIGLDASFSHLAPPPGDIAFVSQSGAMITGVLDWAAPRRIGFSHVVSLGDMADVDFGDMLDYLAADAGTHAILLYVEGITQARKFMSAARSAARSKLVLAVKTGRFAEGARAAHSHTGALAGSDAVYDAALRRAGILRVDSTAELFDALETLALTRTQRGEHLAILTNGGGPGVIAVDRLSALGGKLAELSPETIAKLDAVLPRTWSRGNPVDIIGDAPGRRYAAALTILLQAPELDAVLVLNCPTALGDARAAAQAVIETLKETDSVGMPRPNIFTAWIGEHSAGGARQLFAEAGIATYDTPDDAVDGFMHRVRYHRNQEVLMEAPAAMPESREPDRAVVQAAIDGALKAGRYWLDADEVMHVLAAYGVPVVKSRVVADPDSAARAAVEIGGPVVLKIRSPDITHKSDVGGVVLNIGNPDRVRSEAAAMLERLRAARPQARLDGFLVEEMVQPTGSIELIVGLVADAVFGPVVMFGQGGIAVEQLNDTTLELPPLNMALARAQIARTRVWRLLQGYRGQAPAKIDVIAETLIRIGQLGSFHPEICELDINPLIADARGVLALDARIGVAPVGQGRNSAPAISPYPREFESVGSMRDGTAVRLRPVRPEDEPLLQDIVANMTPVDQWRRFFSPTKQMPHDLAARLSQIDYDREMALIALSEDGTSALGVARYSADPDNRSAEFAIALRSDASGRGLGYLLMTKLLDVARQRGVGELFGHVARDNAPMVTLCRSLDFTVTSDPMDPALLRASHSVRADQPV